MADKDMVAYLCHYVF